MTREEAKEVLDDMKVKIDIPKSAVTQHKRNEALDMAISALSAPSANVISIDQVNAMIKSYVSHYEENKGEWTRHTRVEPVYSIDGVKTWGDKCQCNKCTFTTIAVEGFGYYNFCPNCGANMRGEE